MIIYTASQIKDALNLIHDLPFILQAIRDELISFSKGNYITPIPLHLDLSESKGECHIKTGYNKYDDIFVIKVATGFYTNVLSGLPAGDGLMLIVCKKTGLIKFILYDAGYLTTLRTAITACLTASLTPWEINRVSVIGTGNLAQFVLALMHQQYPKAIIHLWGRNKLKVKQIQAKNPYVRPEDNLSSLINQGGIVCTTTASKTPIIYPQDICDKIHIIALGADQPGKQEIDTEVFSMADLVIVDNKEQAYHFGDSAIALENKKITSCDLIEIGHVLQFKINKNTHMIITDLIGTAPQDIGIAKYLLQYIT